jgi:hypothetical protein
MLDTRRRAARCFPVAALLLLTSVAACKKSEPPAPAADAAPAPAAAAAPAPVPSTGAAAAPVTVVALGIGKALGPDKKVVVEMDTFAKSDTFYAAVGTTGAGSAKLTAKWSLVPRSGADKPISEDTQAIAPTTGATTEFHISKPGGWAAGDYKIEILLDGKSVATKAFRVAK